MDIFTKAFYKNFSYRIIEIPLLKELIAFCAPLVMDGLVLWFYSDYNRVSIVSVLGDGANGVYAITAKFGMFISIPIGCFMLAWQETAFNKTMGNASSEFFSSYFTSFLKILCAAYILLIPVINITFPYLVAPVYSEAKNFVPLYALCSMIMAITWFLSIIIIGLKKNKIVIITTLCGSVFNVLIMSLFLERFGIQTSNISLIAAVSLVWFLRELFLKRLIGFRANYKAVFPILPLVLLMAFNPIKGVYYNLYALIFVSLFGVWFLRSEARLIYRYFSKV
jgi:O-antigen/teichoic acid export membrane protein